MGTVYKGIDPAINRPVALKTIRLDFVNDPTELAELKERLYREAQRRVNCPIRYCDDLRRRLRGLPAVYRHGVPRRPDSRGTDQEEDQIQLPIIAQTIIQICNALTYAHERGIVHRDIKPANVMVLKDYTVKVMDFGIARIDSNSMTKTGIAMGTPNYISPEQLKGQATDRRAICSPSVL